MDILILLIPLSVVLVLLIGAGFWWSVKSGQFDDLEDPAHRILADDDSGGAEATPRGPRTCRCRSLDRSQTSRRTERP